MRIVDGTGFQRVFNESPTLATYSSDAGERVSQILGTVEQLAVTGDDDLTVFDFGTIAVKGGTLRAFGDGTVYAMAGVVYAHDNVRVVAFGETKVVSYGSVSVTASDKVTVVAYERSRVTLRSFASATLHDYCQGSFHNFTRADLRDQAIGYGYDMAEVEIDGDHASLRARGSVRAQVHGSPSVWLAGNAAAHTSDDRTKFIVTTDNARIVPGTITHAADVSLAPSATPTVGYQNGGSPDADRATVSPRPHSAPTQTAAAAREFRDESSVTPVATAASPAGLESSSGDDPHVAGPLPDFGPEWRPLRPSGE